MRSGRCSDAGSVFDEGSEPGKSLIPLVGDAVEIIADLEDRLRVEREEAVAAGAHAANDTGALENAQMLGNGLACEMRAVRELRDGPGATAAESGNQGETGAVAERGEGGGGVLRSASRVSGGRYANRHGPSAPAGGRSPAG